MPKYLASRGSLQQGTASSLAFHLGNMLSGGGGYILHLDQLQQHVPFRAAHTVLSLPRQAHCVLCQQMQSMLLDTQQDFLQLLPLWWPITCGSSERTLARHACMC